MASKYLKNIAHLKQDYIYSAFLEINTMNRNCMKKICMNILQNVFDPQKKESHTSFQQHDNE